MKIKKKRNRMDAATIIYYGLLMLIILIFAVIGLTIGKGWSLKEWRRLFKPRIKLTINDPKKLKDVLESIGDFTLEEQLVVLRRMVGECEIVIDVSAEGLRIIGIGHSPSDDNRKELRGYTG